MTRRRVAVVDDHDLIREGLASLVPQHTVIAGFADVPSLLAARPVVDVVLLDLDLAGVGDAAVVQGRAAVRAVNDTGYPILIYTNERRRRVLVECVAAGARGVVHKAEPLDTLTTAIDSVAAGEVVITVALSGLAELYARRGQLVGLTARQSEVLSAKARGTSNLAIAEQLHLSRRTVEFHVGAINKKFAAFLTNHSPADLERHLGRGEGDLLDWRTAPAP